MYLVHASYYFVLKYEVRDYLFKSFVSLEPPVVVVMYNHPVNVYFHVFEFEELNGWWKYTEK